MTRETAATETANATQNTVHVDGEVFYFSFALSNWLIWITLHAYWLKEFNLQRIGPYFQEALVCLELLEFMNMQVCLVLSLWMKWMMRWCVKLEMEKKGVRMVGDVNIGECLCLELECKWEPTIGFKGNLAAEIKILWYIILVLICDSTI